MKTILITGIDSDQLLEKIGNMIEEKILKPSSKQQRLKETQFLSREEVAQLLKISLPTLNEWSKLGWLKSYKMGNRVLYKQDEVEESFTRVSALKYKKGANHG